MKIGKIIFTALAATTSLFCSAEGMNGNELLQKLNNKDIGGLHYISGIVDSINASRLVFEINLMKTNEKTRKEAVTNLGQFWGCRPEKASYGQVADITSTYLNSHPDIRHFEAVLLIAGAMRESWPCANK